MLGIGTIMVRPSVYFNLESEKQDVLGIGTIMVRPSVYFNLESEKQDVLGIGTIMVLQSRTPISCYSHTQGLIWL